jgi:hypothetical protein
MPVPSPLSWIDTTSGWAVVAAPLPLHLMVDSRSARPATTHTTSPAVDKLKRLAILSCLLTSFAVVKAAARQVAYARLVLGVSQIV